jgi:hypothetical protein
MRLLVALVLLSTFGLAGTASATAAEDTDYFAWLHGSARYPSAHGSSEYERDGVAREVEVTIRGISQLAGKRITVFVNRTRVGTMRVSPRGRAHKQWKTERGQAVPKGGRHAHRRGDLSPRG